MRDGFLKRSVLAVAAVVSLATGLLAQPHFSFTATTGNNMTVLIQPFINPTVSGLSLALGDEIGVFTTAGLCVGAAVWDGSNIAITVWGDNDQTPLTDGIQTGDTLKFRVWDASKSLEVPAVVTYSSGGPVYGDDGRAILSSLVAATYPVTYDGNGNTDGSAPTDVNTYPQGATVSVADNTGNLAKTGSSFAGWNTAADGSGTNYAGSATLLMGTSHVTLYAKWIRISYTLSIAHVIGSAAPITDKDTLVHHGDTVRIVAPAIPGCAFTKWRITSGTAVLVDSFAQPAKVILTSGNATVTAVYLQMVGVSDWKSAIPSTFDLICNPSSPIVRIAVPCVSGSSGVMVRVTLFDARGRLVSVLANKEMQAGYHDVKMATGKNAMPAWGICRIEAKGFSRTAKVLMVK